MKIIAGEMAPWTGPEENRPVVMRVIHASADFDFQKNLLFTPDAVRKGREALAAGIPVVTDTAMAAAGINKAAAARFGVSILCHIAEPSVRAQALARGVTRSLVSMEEAVRYTPGAIFAIGNAPTALIRLCELINEKRAAPALVIGVPVGFVNVVESKELLLQTPVPSIAAAGRKGGSTIASDIVNALLYGIHG